MAPTIKLSFPETRAFWELSVLFEDGHLLALDKPTGLLSLPDHDHPERPSLLGLLHAGIAQGKSWARERGLTHLTLVNRLETEVGGIVLFAKSKPVQVQLSNLFGAEKPLLRYLCLVSGAPPEDQFEVNAPLAPDLRQVGETKVDTRHGKKSRTLFSVLERFSRWTLLKCEPLTARPHQIQAHLRYVKLPIAGDAFYGGRPLLLSRLKPAYRLKPGRQEQALLGRTALHAAGLTFNHPVTGEPLNIESPQPKDLTVALKYLRQYASPQASL